MSLFERLNILFVNGDEPTNINDDHYVEGGKCISGKQDEDGDKLREPKKQADGGDIGTLSLHDKTKYKELNGLLQMDDYNENKYMGGNSLNYTINTDINDIMNNKQNLMEKMIKINDEINDIKSNNNDTDLYKNFELKENILTNIGNHINNLSESIKKGGDENISNELNNDIYTYENIVNKIKNSNNNSNINIKIGRAHV